MKKICVAIAGIILFFFNAKAFSQNVKFTVSPIESYQLSITYLKTTNLVFPYAIKSVDRGSQSILAQKAIGAENILQIKAGNEDFKETNLTVITAEGRLYSFLLNYAAHPPVLNLAFLNTEPIAQLATLTTENYNIAEVENASRKVAAAERKTCMIKGKKFGIHVQMNGLFILDNVMYYRVNIQNYSNINYDIDQLRFYIRDKKIAKRTARQEIEVTPIHIHDNTGVVDGQSQHTIVYALPKMTIPDQKQLFIQVMEKNGGRHLELQIKNKIIVKARTIDQELKSIK